MITNIIIILEILVSSLIFLILGIKTLKAWKILREEMFLHLTLFFFTMSIITIIFSIYVYPNIFGELVDPNVVIIIMGFVYDLFYLEISIIYLSIFTNSRTVFESYAPFIIGAATVINVYSEISTPNIDASYFITFIHIMVISIGVFLVTFGVRHLIKSRKYITDDEEKHFLNYLITISKFIPFFLITDGIGFLLYERNTELFINLNQYLFFVLYSFLLFFSILILYVAGKLTSKSKSINLTKFLNTIS